MVQFERFLSCLERLASIHRELLVVAAIVVVFGDKMEYFFLFLIGLFS